jgi:LuxR family maltose regulon positive regulatory protein
MIPPLLTTRLHRPSLRAHHVSRPRLVERLRAAADPRLAVVVGPAGYGKTTLLAEWLSELAAAQPAPCLAWVSLDAGDDDPIRFWSTLIASLRLGCGQPDLGAEALGLLRTPGPRPLEAVVTLLLNELTTLPAPLWLALDDYHLIQAPAIHGSLARLIEHLPAAVHVAIATRADPPLGLARLRARGALCEIGPQTCGSRRMRQPCS